MIWPVTIAATLAGLWIAGIPGGFLGLVGGVLIDRHLDLPNWAALRQRMTGRFAAPQQPAELTRFMLLGYLAKLNGRVLPAHIQRARMEMQRMRLEGYRYQAAIEAFSRGKGIQLLELKALLQAGFKGEKAEQLLLSAWHMVWAERKVSPLQRKTLEQCAEWLGVGASRLAELERIAAPAAAEYRPAVTVTEVDRALATLGLAPGTRSFAQVQRAYRRLLSEHHPDKLTGAGATRQQIERANDKTQELHGAFALLRRHYRG